MPNALSYIAGCQRSGTTLLRLIIECHPDVYCFDENLGYEILSAQEPQSRIPKEIRETKSIFSFKIPRFTEMLLEPEMHDPMYGIVRQFYHGEKIIFLVRDVRDVIASMLKLSAGSRTWLEEWGVSILNFKMRQEKFAQRYAAEMNLVMRAQGRKRLLLSGALYWKYKNDAFSAYAEAGLPIHLARYNDLVEKPDINIKTISNFLGLKWDNNLLKHHERPHDQLDADGLAIGHTDPKKPINAHSVARYKSILTDEEEEAIMGIAEGTMIKLGMTVG